MRRQVEEGSEDMWRKEEETGRGGDRWRSEV